MTTRLSICVICSAENLTATYTKPAREFAKRIAECGHTLIWGGSNVGLMEVVATTAQLNGAKIIGVSVEYLKHKARKNADEMIIAKTLDERKQIMFGRADVIVMLVGGIGTLDEATELLEHKKHGHHTKPIFVLNTNHFYEGLKLQLKQMEDSGFIPMPLDSLITFAESPTEIVKLIDRASR